MLHDVDWGKPWRAEKGANGCMIASHLNDHDSCAKRQIWSGCNIYWASDTTRCVERLLAVPWQVEFDGSAVELALGKRAGL